MSKRKELQVRESELRVKVLEAKRNRAALGDAALAENRALTNEERASFVAAGKAIDALEADLADTTNLLAAADAAATAEAAATAATAAAATAAAQASGQAQGQVQVVDMTKRPGFFGRQLQAVLRFAANGGWSSLSGEDRTVLQPMMAAGPSGLNTDVGSEGGFLVGQDRATTILAREYATGEIMQRLSPLPISAGSNGITLPAVDETSRADGSRYGGVTSTWIGQGLTVPASKPKIRQMELKLKKIAGFLFATDELIRDATALEAWALKYIPLELLFRIEDAVVNGSGAGMPLGWINSGAVVSVSRGTSGHVTSIDLRTMIARLWAPLRSRAVFLYDQSIEPDLNALSIVISQAGVLDPAYRPAGSVPGQKYATYAGIPMIPVEYCAALGTAGDIQLVAPDEYTLIDKGGVDQAVSIHVQFLTDEQVFRFVQRVDGQSNWNKTLTPKSGSSPVSPWVVLAT